MKAEEDDDDANGGNTLRGSGGKKGRNSKTKNVINMVDYFVIFKDGFEFDRTSSVIAAGG